MRGGHAAQVDGTYPGESLSGDMSRPGAEPMCTVKSQSTISASGFRQIPHEQRDPSPFSALPSISAVSMR